MTSIHEVILVPGGFVNADVIKGVYINSVRVICLALANKLAAI